MKQQTTENKGPSLTDRMKAYEAAATTYFTRRMPIIIRLDGKAFSKFTNKHFEKPFDKQFSQHMQAAVSYLMSEIQGCVFAFSQSDEISLFLRDYDSLNTESWFGSNLQKIVSVTASMATARFNQSVVQTPSKPLEIPATGLTIQVGSDNSIPLAVFDSRAFILPKEEVVNYFIYRQHDGVRNSVQMLAQHVFGHKFCQNKKVDELKVELSKNGHDWNDIDAVFRHGFCMKKGDYMVNTEIDLFKDNRNFIEELVYVKSE
jgi:tRNA(His) guanylyltransferase